VRLVVRAKEEAGGVVVRAFNRYTYTPYGQFYEGQCIENIANPWKFTGQWHDEEIDQYYLRARQYDPTMMRFTSRDPVRGKMEEPLTLHRYLYCINSPTRYIDPSGEFSVPEILVNMAWTTSVGAFSGAMGGLFYSMGYMIGNPDRFANMTDDQIFGFIMGNVESGAWLGAVSGAIAGLGSTEAVVTYLYSAPGIGTGGAFIGGIVGGGLTNLVNHMFDALQPYMKGSQSITRMNALNDARNATVEIICETWF
jgi:RHS repeat-associated protein